MFYIFDLGENLKENAQETHQNMSSLINQNMDSIINTWYKCWTHALRDDKTAKDIKWPGGQ